MKDIRIADGVIHEIWEDAAIYVSPIEAYGAEEAKSAKKFILGRLLDTNNHPSFEEKDRLVECLKIMNEVIEREINNSAINST